MQREGYERLEQRRGHMVEEILNWVSNELDTIAKRDFEQEAAEEDWDQDNLNDDRRFSKILHSVLIAMTRGSANRIVQIGDPGDGVDAWC